MPKGIYDRTNQTDWKPNSGRFQKGEHRSLETEFKKGIHPNNVFKKGVGSGLSWSARCGSAHWYKLQSETHKGQHSSPETEIKRGQRLSPETEFKELVPGGVSSEDMRLRNAPEYRQWRMAIYKRDDFVCQRCKVRGGRLEAHHIKPFATHPELRFDVDNGITLCKSCHRGGDAKCQRVIQ